MEEAVRAHGRGGVDPPFSVYVRQAPARLLDEDLRRSQVPGCGCPSRTSPRRHPAPRGRSPRSRRNRAPARRPRAWHPGPASARSRRRRGRFRRASWASARSAIRETRMRRSPSSARFHAPTTAARVPALAHRGGRDHAGLELAVDLDGQERAEERHAPDEVVGAVDRVDVPADPGVAGLRRRTPRRPARGPGRRPRIRSRITRSIARSATVTNERSGFRSAGTSRRNWWSAIASATSQAASEKSSHSRSCASGTRRSEADQSGPKEGASVASGMGPRRSDRSPASQAYRGAMPAPR